jgi:hypothetical protein
VIKEEGEAVRTQPQQPHIVDARSLDSRDEYNIAYPSIISASARRRICEFSSPGRPAALTFAVGRDSAHLPRWRRVRRRRATCCQSILIKKVPSAYVYVSRRQAICDETHLYAGL